MSLKKETRSKNQLGKEIETFIKRGDRLSENMKLNKYANSLFYPRSYWDKFKESLLEVQEALIH